VRVISVVAIITKNKIGMPRYSFAPKYASVSPRKLEGQLLSATAPLVSTGDFLRT